MNRKPTLNSRFNRYSRRAQSGQVIILMAFGMIALLAVLGLAVDGGRLYFLERDAQNASDAAVLAATHALCTGGDPVQAGLDAAARNGFTSSEVTVASPPSRTLADASADPNDYAEVIINADIPSYFIHLVYGGDLAVSTLALGHCTVGWDPYTDGRAIIATHDCSDCSISFKINGGRDIHIRGGVATNGDIQSQGNNHIIEDSVDYGNACSVSANNTIWDSGEPVCMPSGAIVEVPLLYNIEDFRPGGIVEAIYGPQGLYHVVSGQSNNMSSYPNGGIFYSAGDVGFTHTYDGAIDSAPAITIVAEGNIHIKANENRLRGLYDNGLVLFSTAGVSGCDKNLGIDVTGSDTAWKGLIYAPYSHVSIPGSNAETSWGAIIADTVSITGSQADIFYDASYLPDPETAIEIAQ